MAGGRALELLEGEVRVARLSPDEPIPGWATGGPLVSVTRTGEELSVLCLAERIPGGTRTGPAQRVLRVEGTLDFALTGILAGLTECLARADIPVFAISTFDTDYLLVPAREVVDAVAALRGSGYRVTGD